MTGSESSFGARLREFRVAAGLSQVKLAKIIRFDSTLVSKVETGRVLPSEPFARAADAALDACGVLVALAPHTPLTPDDEERLRRSVETPSRVDTAVVESLATMLASYRTLEDSVGSGAILASVSAQVAVVTGLVTEARGPIRSRVLDIGSQWTQFGGWLATNTGRHADAVRQYDQTLALAIETGSPGMTATALSMKGHLAWRTGQVHPMISLSAAAATHKASPGVLSIAAQQHARGLALTGDADECERLLDHAVECAARVDPDNEPPWIYFHDRSYLDLQRGLAYRYLGHLDHAIELLNAGLAALPPEMRDTEWAGLYLYQLAVAHAQDHDHTAAATTLESAENIAQTLDAGNLTRKLARLRRQLAMAPDSGRESGASRASLRM